METRNDELELPGGSYSVSDIQGYTEYIIREHETLTTIPLVHVHINRINNGLAFLKEDGCKPELRTAETMKLLAKTKNKLGKKNRENIPSLEVVEVVLVQCSLVDNQYQQKAEVLLLHPIILCLFFKCWSK